MSLLRWSATLAEHDCQSSATAAEKTHRLSCCTYPRRLPWWHLSKPKTSIQRMQRCLCWLETQPQRWASLYLTASGVLMLVCKILPLGSTHFPFLWAMPLPRSIPESSHHLPGLKSAKEVNTCAPLLYRQETVVVSGSMACLGWEQILQILLLVLLELLSPFCFFYGEKSFPFCRAETKWWLIYADFVFNKKEVSENLKKRNFK